MSTEPEINLDLDNLPPIAPGPDETVTSNTAFESQARACLGERSGRRLGNSLMTLSKQWGPVWRVDIEEPRNQPGHITRGVCWNDPKTGRDVIMYYSDREIHPLPA